MSVIRISTPYNIDIEFEGAPFHRRLFAWAIDFIIQIFYLILASKIYVWLITEYMFDEEMMQNFWGIGLLLILPFIVYHLVSEITLGGQSIGKKLMKLRIVNENGGKPSISQYIIRWLIRTTDMTLLFLFLNAPDMAIAGVGLTWGLVLSFCLLITDVILVNSSKKNQRLGDMLAHTIIIRTGEKADIDDTVFLHVEQSYVPSFPQVMQLSDRDINALKSILDNARKTHNYELAEQASEKIKNHLQINTSMSPFDFLEVLLKDYNYLSTQ